MLMIRLGLLRVLARFSILRICSGSFGSIRRPSMDDISIAAYIGSVVNRPYACLGVWENWHSTTGDRFFKAGNGNCEGGILCFGKRLRVVKMGE